MPQKYPHIFKIFLFCFLSLFFSKPLFAETFELKLKSGHNLISVPIGTSWKIKDVLTIKNAIKKQAAYWDTAASNYIFYAGDPEFDQFFTFDYQKGYWVYIEDPAGFSTTLTNTVPASSTLTLKQGWNLIGCPYTKELPVEDALYPLKLGTDYLSVWSFFSPNPPYYQQYSKTKKEFLTLKPGQGYWIRMLKNTNWAVNPNKPPIIKSVTPENNSIFLAGAKITIKVDAFSINTPLQYQFSIGGTVKQAWSPSNTYIWQTSSSDTASVSITCEVKDSKGLKATKAIACQIINPTVEQILQKVADNYAKIYDFKADMTLSSTLDGKPFGQTEYCRYYFKAPNKEKTESFTDSSRKTRTEIMITNNSDLYLIDPVNKITEKVDLLAEADITGAQFSQMDIYYNLLNFINTHIVTENTAKTDFINKIIAFDVIPKASNYLYAKLELFVDYDKGLLTKSCLYKNDEGVQATLLQTIEEMGSQKFANGAYLPNKIRKTPVLKSGNLIEVALYDNLQVNTGLSDVIFDPNKQY